jgi:ribonucleoside-diphosphate reductase alpha chain
MTDILADQHFDDSTMSRSDHGLAERHFTREGEHPFESVEWGVSDAVIKDYKTGVPVFEQKGVEFPTSFDQTGVNIVASKYFRGHVGSPEREVSLKQVIDRIVGTVTAWGVKFGYYDAAGAARHGDELRYLMANQMMAFNSPVWFNIGVPGVPQQSSACFILDVDDDMQDILEWYVEEGMIFKGGSGAGVNLSRIRSSKEALEGGGMASGPVTFMRGADASAGTIKSGGKTRRAAKMVILDADHPDIEEFIWCKALEERKARDLKAAGWEMGVDGKDAFSIQYQNANNSVRVTDAFMDAVVNDAMWDLTARSTGAVVDSVPARSIWRAIAEAAYECADPGLQFDSTIEKWNTTPSVKLRASNPCSEHIRADNSSCNLASLNLLAFLSSDGVFNVDAFVAACETTFLAQDILICGSDFPTAKIAEVTRTYRDLGLGYANLGALLMACGLPYDSREGRVLAAAISGVLTASAYRMSTKIAEHLEPFPAFGENRDGAVRVMDRHRQAAQRLSRAAVGGPNVHGVVAANVELWEQVVDRASLFGLRNAQATVLAPTGTISFAMGCDTTGVEPAFSLVTYKTLVGGGSLKLTIKSVGRALATLGYSPSEASAISTFLVDNGTLVGAPGLRADHLAVFATAVGDNEIVPSGHTKMMAAVQPFISGAISKTVNLPSSTTVEDIEQVHLDAWKSGIKCLAIYRDGSKVGQPLSTSAVSESVPQVDVQALIDEAVAKAIAELRNAPARQAMPKECSARRVEFNIGGLKGWLTVSEYANGQPGELFVQVSKAGSTLQGLVNSWSKMASKALQYGVPLESIVQDFANTRFEPAGMTGVRDVPMASSLLDFVVKFLAVRYLAPDVRAELGIFTTQERVDYVASSSHPASQQASQSAVQLPAVSRSGFDADAPICPSDGTPMVRAGACFACPSCGGTSGCS